jgi:hypothetical protein
MLLLVLPSKQAVEGSNPSALTSKTTVFSGFVVLCDFTFIHLLPSFAKFYLLIGVFLEVV